jgi:hypothetical protein
MRHLLTVCKVCYVCTLLMCLVENNVCFWLRYGLQCYAVAGRNSLLCMRSDLLVKAMKFLHVTILLNVCV